MEEARLKLKVVERLLEDRPVELSDEDSESPQTSERAFLKLTALVKPLTGEEFMSACEERCLSGLCGWPLCA
ncbi:Rtr1/RPAP2 family protein phosphatase, partial [bacterium]|nr:Rtr1/RPAP2 family protein phosphatase [bacterium]